MCVKRVGRGGGERPEKRARGRVKKIWDGTVRDSQPDWVSFLWAPLTLPTPTRNASPAPSLGLRLPLCVPVTYRGTERSWFGGSTKPTHRFAQILLHTFPKLEGTAHVGLVNLEKSGFWSSLGARRNYSFLSHSAPLTKRADSGGGKKRKRKEKKKKLHVVDPESTHCDICLV